MPTLSPTTHNAEGCHQLLSVHQKDNFLALEGKGRLEAAQLRCVEKELGVTAKNPFPPVCSYRKCGRCPHTRHSYSWAACCGQQPWPPQSRTASGAGSFSATRPPVVTDKPVSLFGI